MHSSCEIGWQVNRSKFGTKTAQAISEVPIASSPGQFPGFQCCTKKKSGNDPGAGVEARYNIEK